MNGKLAKQKECAPREGPTQALYFNPEIVYIYIYSTSLKEHKLRKEKGRNYCKGKEGKQSSLRKARREQDTTRDRKERKGEKRTGDQLLAWNMAVLWATPSTYSCILLA